MKNLEEIYNFHISDFFKTLKSPKFSEKIKRLCTACFLEPERHPLTRQKPNDFMSRKISNCLKNNVEHKQKLFLDEKKSHCCFQKSELVSNTVWSNTSWSYSLFEQNFIFCLSWSSAGHTSEVRGSHSHNGRCVIDQQQRPTRIDYKN